MIVTQYYWPENFRINELSYELKKAGNNVTVITGYPNYPSGKIFEDFRKNPKKFSHYKGIEVIRVPVIPRGRNKLNLFANYLSFVINGTLIGIFKLFKRKFDIVFTFQTSPVSVGIPSSIINSLKKSSQIIWILDLWPETLSAIGIINKKWQLEIIRRFVEIIYSNCEIILVQSKSFIKKIKNFNKNKIIYFPAWTESEFINSSKEPAKEIIIKKDIFTILFAGNIGEAQDFPSIVKAAEELVSKNFHKFRIITLGIGSRKDWLIEEVKRKKLDNYFEILDKYPLYRMPSFFAHADSLLVSLMNKEAFNMTIPGKIQTYLSSGVPLIGMLTGEGAKTIIKSNSGFVCPAGDYKGLSEIIIKMSSMTKQSRKELAYNGISFCKKEFNKEKLMDKLNSIMHELYASRKN